MFHLFGKVFLDHEKHLNSRDEALALSSRRKEHPLGAVVGQNLGEILSFDQFLEQHYQGNVEHFWAKLLSRDPQASRRLVLFTDHELHFRLQIQYWKSIFEEPECGLLFELYELFRSDYDLKRLLTRDRGENFLGHYQDLYPCMTLSEFSERQSQIVASTVIRESVKDLVSVEYLIANFLADPSTPVRAALKQRVLRLAWKNWFNDVNGLKCEILAGAVNLEQLFPEISSEMVQAQGPMELIRTHPSLRWILDERLSPGNEGHVVARYPIDFFPEIQRRLDHLCRVRVKIKGLEQNEVDTFNNASDTRRLYASDFEGILQDDFERCFGSFFMKGRDYWDFNHYFIGLLYKAAKTRDTQSLSRFRLVRGSLAV